MGSGGVPGRKMSMYHFVRGPRLFIQAAREETDPDAVNQNPNQDEMFEYGRSGDGEIHRIQTQRVLNTESHGTAQATNRVARKGGLKSITRKIIRKTTTLTRGEQRTVTESMVTQTGKDGKEMTTPQRFVSETVVRTPWGTTDEDELDEVPHSSRNGSRMRSRSSSTKRDSYTTMTQMGNNGHHHHHHGWTSAHDLRSKKVYLHTGLNMRCTLHFSGLNWQEIIRLMVEKLLSFKNTTSAEY